MRKGDLVYIWTAPYRDNFWFFEGEEPDHPKDFSVFDEDDSEGLVGKSLCEVLLPREYAS